MRKKKDRNILVTKDGDSKVNLVLSKLVGSSTDVSPTVLCRNFSYQQSAISFLIGPADWQMSIKFLPSYISSWISTDCAVKLEIMCSFWLGQILHWWTRSDNYGMGCKITTDLMLHHWKPREVSHFVFHFVMLRLLTFYKKSQKFRKGSPPSLVGTFRLEIRVPCIFRFASFAPVPYFALHKNGGVIGETSIPT